MSDRWVVLVLKANIPTKDRRLRWPAVFSLKYLASGYQNKGRASKRVNLSNGKYFYDAIFGTFEIYGAEGRAAGYNRQIRRTRTSTCVLGKGREYRENGILLTTDSTKRKQPEEGKNPTKR